MHIAMIGQKGIGSGARMGGVEKHVEEISTRLVAMGHTVTVYAQKRYANTRPQELPGLNFVFLPSLPLKHFETWSHTLLAILHSIKKPYDIIHYHGVGPATLAWIHRLLARSKSIIITFHSRDQFHKKWGWFARQYLKFGERAAVWFGHYTIAVSHAIQLYCRKDLKTETIYIPNGATVKEISTSDLVERIGLRPKKYFVNVGRLVPQKGLHFLIEAFIKLDTDFQLVFVGAPSFTTEYYQRLRDATKGDQRVVFLGYKTGDMLDQLFANAYAFIHPSEAEGLPLVVLESMAYGVPVLVSDIPENIEATHGAGFTFPNRNVHGLRSQIGRLIKSPTMVKARGHEAQAVIDIHFNWDNIARKVESVYITARH